VFQLLDTPAGPGAAPVPGRVTGAGAENGAAAAPAHAAATPMPAPAIGLVGALGGNGVTVAHARTHAHPLPTPTGRLKGRIEFANVWFAYLGEDWVLRDVDLVIEPGEKVALVGATGSGKTTLSSLLFRFYEPQRGVIRVDGRDIREWDLCALRRRMGLVLQDVFLFSGTIESNLRLGAPAASRERLLEAAREARALPLIERLPGGLEATVRERGAGLSSGERQLIAFARALAHDPDVLVLDEATASVDPHTEERLQEALRRLLAGRTSLVIAHRLSTIQDVNRIVVLHHGQIRETGTHAELMARHGIYERLYQLQLLGGVRRVETPAAEPGWDEFAAARGRVDTRGDVT
jgi:ATP-binding cassette subfamily B protein